MAVSVRAIHFGLLGAALALTAWVLGAQRGPANPASGASTSRSGAHSSPLALIPAGSAFVLTVDLRELERAPLGAFLAERLGNAGGAGKLATLCGFDPLARLDQLALAVPSAGLAAQEHPEDFGIVASGRFTAAEISHCASAAIAERGGEAVQTELGHFSSVRDRKGSGGEVAARDGGPLIVSGGNYFRQLLDAAEGNAEKLEHQDARDARHAELRRTLGPAPIVATWLLGEGWFERVSGDSDARLSPLGALKAVAARIDVGNDAHLSVWLECADADAATRISTLLTQLRASLAALPLDPALSGAAKRIALTASGARLELALSLSQAELTPLLDLLAQP